MVFNDQQVAERILSAVKEREPFSFVRLGDGEGLLLSFDAMSRLEDYSYLAEHFGKRAEVHHIQRARANLVDTIADANLIGIRDDVLNASQDAAEIDPDSEGFARDFLAAFPLRPAERDRLAPHGMRRIFMLRRWFRDFPFVPGQSICSAWTPADLQLSGFWDDLIASQEHITLITSAPGLEDRLRKRFAVEAETITIPRRAVHTESSNRSISLAGQHVHGVQQIALSIPKDLNGRVVLIGAGLAGKHYCRIVKSNGGIALDVGALLDAWDGRSTRPLVYADKAPLTASRFAPPPAFCLGWPVRPLIRSPEKQLIVHAGFSKTGTTTLQMLLAASVDQLQTDGVCYLSGGRGGSTPHNHHFLATALGNGARPYQDDPPPPDVALSRKLLSDLSEEIEQSPCSTFIISSELLTNFKLCRETEDMFFEFLLSFNSTVLFCVRNQFDWLCSWYTQAAKNGNMGLWLDEFLSDPMQLPNSERFDGNFLRKIDYFSRCIGSDRVKVLDFDKHARDNSLVSGFLREIGIRDVAAYRQVPHANVSPGGDEIARKVVGRRLGIEKPVEGFGRLDQSIIDRALLLGSHALRRKELKDSIRTRYAAINRAMKEKYGLEISFSEDEG